MSACTSPTCYGVPAHLAIDITPRPKRIRAISFYAADPLQYLTEAMAFRDCARLERQLSYDKTVKISPSAKRYMLARMRRCALNAVKSVRNQLAKQS